MKKLNDAAVLSEVLTKLSLEKGVEPLPEFSSEQAKAESLVRRHSSKGNNLIRRVLSEKGLSNAVIDDALLLLPPEKERALIPARKKYSRIKADSTADKTSKTAAYLSSRGFSPTVCWSAAKHVSEELEKDVVV